MAKFAPVAPLNIAINLANLGALGDYHLLLAHDVIASEDNKKEYRELYKPIVDNGGLIIMDNSVVELGGAVNCATVLEAARVVNAEYIVSADAFLDMEGTMNATHRFIQDYYSYQWAEVPRLVGVVQGRTTAECLMCADLYASIKAFRGIAIPRCLTPVLGSRMPLAIELYKRYSTRFSLWHLLGFSDDLVDDVATARLPWIDGIDSAAPLRAGVKGIGFSMPAFDAGPRGSFWETPNSLANLRRHDIENNVNLVRKVVQMDPKAFDI